jgi:GTPase SAR1 family protein
MIFNLGKTSLLKAFGADIFPEYDMPASPTDSAYIPGSPTTDTNFNSNADHIVLDVTITAETTNTTSADKKTDTNAPSPGKKPVLLPVLNLQHSKRELSFFELSGNDEENKDREAEFSKANVVLLCYDVTSESSYSQVAERVCFSQSFHTFTLDPTFFLLLCFCREPPKHTV